MKVLCNGNWDILHSGHFNILNFCRELATSDGEVVVCIDSDERVHKQKGAMRPVLPAKLRITNLAVLKSGGIPMINRIHLFNSDEDLLDIIKGEKPNIIVKGSEWKGKRVIGDEIAPIYLYTATRNGIGSKISTTDIVNLIIEKYEGK